MGENAGLVMAILVAVLAVSEALAFVPSIKSNGVFQWVVNIAKAIKDGISK